MFYTHWLRCSPSWNCLKTKSQLWKCSKRKFSLLKRVVVDICKSMSKLWLGRQLLLTVRQMALTTLKKLKPKFKSWKEFHLISKNSFLLGNNLKMEDLFQATILQKSRRCILFSDFEVVEDPGTSRLPTWWLVKLRLLSQATINPHWKSFKMSWRSKRNATSFCFCRKKMVRLWPQLNLRWIRSKVLTWTSSTLLEWPTSCSTTPSLCLTNLSTVSSTKKWSISSSTKMEWLLKMPKICPQSFGTPSWLFGFWRTSFLMTKTSGSW